MIKKILISILILVLISFYWLNKGIIQQKFVSSEHVEQDALQQVKIVAHRGASGYAPENTMSAFKKALEFNPDFIELDLHMSKDGEAVVIHDATLDRTTDGSGLVQDYNMNELKKLDAGSWFSEEFKGERLSTLDETIEWLNGRSILLIEIKRGKYGIYEGLGKKVVDVIDQYQARPWCIVQAFDSDYIREVNEYAPGVKTHKLVTYNIDILPFYVDYKFQSGVVDEGLEVEAINSYYKMLTKSRVRERHNSGYETYVYTVNDVPTMKKMINMGVDGIITNYPDRLLNLKLGK